MLKLSFDLLVETDSVFVESLLRDAHGLDHGHSGARLDRLPRVRLQRQQRESHVLPIAEV